MSQIRVSQIRVSQIRVTQIRVSQISVTQIRASQIRASKIRATEISSNHRELHGAIFASSQSEHSCTLHTRNQPTSILFPSRHFWLNAICMEMTSCLSVCLSVCQQVLSTCAQCLHECFGFPISLVATLSHWHHRHRHDRRSAHPWDLFPVVRSAIRVHHGQLELASWVTSGLIGLQGPNTLSPKWLVLWIPPAPSFVFVTSQSSLNPGPELDLQPERPWTWLHCSDITNTLVGISGETVPEGGYLCIYWPHSNHTIWWVVVLNSQLVCRTTLLPQ